MTVFQLCEHVSQYLEKVFVALGGFHLGLILGVDGIPIHLFVIQETVMLIDDAPKGFEIVHWGVLEVVFAHAGRESEQEQDEVRQSFHGLQLFEVFHKTDHQRMTVDMRLQSVELGLLKIAYIAHAQGGLFDLKVHGQ